MRQKIISWALVDGSICEKKCEIKLLELGYEVLLPAVPYPYDLAIRCAGNTLIKIQIKKVTMHNRVCGLKNHTYRGIFLTTGRGRRQSGYSADFVDFFIGVDADNFYIVPFSLAYRNNAAQTNYMLDKNTFNRWDLLPQPHNGPKILSEVEKITQTNLPGLDRTGEQPK